MGTVAHKQEAQLAQLMRQAQAGDGESYRTLLETARTLVLAYTARGLTRMGLADPKTAEDLAQEILLAVHTKRATYDPAQLFTPWLYAIARYKLIDFGRARRRQGIAVDVEALAETLPAENGTAPGTADDLHRLLEELPEKQRRALELVKLEGLSIAETSAATGMSESAVKVSVHRALKGLKARWKKEER